MATTRKKKNPVQNWKWIITTFIIFVIVVGLSMTLIGFSQQQELPDTPLLLKIRTPIKHELDNAVKTDKNIIAIQIVTVNFPRNVRMETFVSIESPTLQEMYNRFIHSKTVDTPLFTEDKENNQRVLRLINGEFVCSPFNQTLAYRYAPQAERLVTSVCALGVPPFHYGEFSGIMAIYLNKNLTPEETQDLYRFARDVSIRIAESNKITNEDR
jgi:hypothetical protein